jgi:hypothetical protein
MKSKKYINEKLLFFENEVLNVATSAAVSSMVGTGMMAGIPALFNVFSAIKRIKDRYDFDKKGCDNIIDPIKRDQCEARQIERLVSQLRTQLNYCRNSKNQISCREKINNEIHKQMMKRKELLQNSQYYNS